MKTPDEPITETLDELLTKVSALLPFAMATRWTIEVVGPTINGPWREFAGRGPSLTHALDRLASDIEEQNG